MEFWSAENSECCMQSAAENVKADLMNRLNNAVKQRDAAREEALLATQKLSQLQEDIDSGALAPSPARTSSLADPGTPPPPLPAPIPTQPLSFHADFVPPPSPLHLIQAPNGFLQCSR
jgi:hypothetical protein